MSSLRSLLSNLRRPRILVHAARHGMKEYDRNRDLKRIAGMQSINNSEAMLSHLVEQEEHIETSRQTGCATYSIARHIEILIALMYECKLLPKELSTS
ncbi:MAG: DUF6477 family protein [Litoreibacter sp.]